jgi:hypothetical protein
LAVVRLCLHILRYATLRQLLTRFTPEQRPPAQHGQPAELNRSAGRVPWAVSAVARRIPGTTCLSQALAVETMLRRRACGARVCFGVKEHRRDEPLEAHAWVEQGGQVVVGTLPNFSEYRVFSELAGLDGGTAKHSRQ